MQEHLPNKSGAPMGSEARRFSTFPMNATPSKQFQVPWRLFTLIGFSLLAYFAFTAGRGGSDPAGPLPFDASQPFQLDFGRGSGSAGLETIAIAENGKATICRRTRLGTWESASLQVSAQQSTQIAQAITRHQLLHLAKEYLGTVDDGTQWILWIRQGTRGKAAYFDNNFPGSIRDFANELDSILPAAGIDKLRWDPSSKQDWELWSAIK